MHHRLNKKTSQTSFSAAVSAYKIIDVKTLKGAERTTAVKQALEKMWEKYPDLWSSDPQERENFKDQMCKDGFLFVAVDTKGKVQGLAAGVIYPQSKTAAFTYFVEPTAKKAEAQRLLDQTQLFLMDRKIGAAFVELAKNGGPTEKADKQLFERLGAVPVPIRDYHQPLDETGYEIRGLHPYVMFTDNTWSSAQKSATANAHFDAFTRAYDPQVAIKANKTHLADYKRDLAKADWSAKPANAPAPRSI